MQLFDVSFYVVSRPFDPVHPRLQIAVVLEPKLWELLLVARTTVHIVAGLSLAGGEDAPPATTKEHP